MSASEKMARADALDRIKGAVQSLPKIIRVLEALVADKAPGAEDALKRIGFARTALDRAQDSLKEGAAPKEGP